MNLRIMAWSASVVGLALAWLAAGAGRVSADTVYASAFSDSHDTHPSVFGRLDLTNGVFTALGTPDTSGAAGSTGFNALGYGSDGQLYGVTSNGFIYTIDPTTGAATYTNYEIALSTGESVYGGGAAGGIFYLELSSSGTTTMVTMSPSSFTSSVNVAVNTLGVLADTNGNLTADGLVAVGGGTVYVGGSDPKNTTGYDSLFSVDGSGHATKLSDTSQMYFAGVFDQGTLYGLTFNAPGQSVYSFDANAQNQALLDGVSGVPSSGGSHKYFIDALTLIEAQAVPEGSSLAMLAIGAGAVVAAVRGRSRRRAG